MVKFTLFGKIVIAVAFFLLAYYVVLPLLLNPRPSQSISSFIPSIAPTVSPPTPAVAPPSTPSVLEVELYVSPFEPSSLTLLSAFRELSQEKSLAGKFSYRAIDYAGAPESMQRFPKSQPPFFVVGGKAYGETDLESIRSIVGSAVQ